MSRIAMNSSCILLFVMGVFQQPAARKQTRGHAQVGEWHRKNQASFSVRIQNCAFRTPLHQTPAETLDEWALREHFLPSAAMACRHRRHSINTENWQLGRREARICLLTALVLHSFSHSLPAGMTPLRDSSSTDGPRLRCNQEQLAKFNPNK